MPAERRRIPRAVTDVPSKAIVVQLPAAMQPYARSLQRWRPGCAIEVLREGEQTYPAMLEAIAAAKRAILFEVYILVADRTGERFKQALLERARAGVTVRMMYDAVGSFGLAESWLTELRTAGAEIIDFNPIAPWRTRGNLSHRDHRKILVVDDEVAFTGGLNISDDYAAYDDGGRGWHDMHCRVRGAAVLDLSRLFRRTWLRSGGSYYPAPTKASQSPSAGGTSFVRLIENSKRRTKGAFRRAYLHVIKQARSYVLIQNAYFLPDLGLRRTLARAVRRGVKVSVMVPGHSDVRMIEYASDYVLRRLAGRGVEILHWQGPMMHAKTAVVDGVWSTIGSYNFDAQSRWHNLEATLEILDPAIGDVLVAEYDRDRQSCTEYDEAAWRRLPWWRKALAWLGYRLRRFL
ncbi:MAG TPA: phosphatidylserine/phosphatidylglycerophosphate/cardiolipin synthase family protein [Kofleriaceae bacterium]|jgi:cardiolipin synthase